MTVQGDHALSRSELERRGRGQVDIEALEACYRDKPYKDRRRLLLEESIKTMELLRKDNNAELFYQLDGAH